MISSENKQKHLQPSIFGIKGGLSRGTFNFLSMPSERKRLGNTGLKLQTDFLSFLGHAESREMFRICHRLCRYSHPLLSAVSEEA